MADFDEPKGFAFGDLNPVSEPRTAKRFDSKHTSALGAMREVVVGHYTPDALASTGPYKGVVACRRRYGPEQPCSRQLVGYSVWRLRYVQLSNCT